jgi:hypothetical protein
MSSKSLMLVVFVSLLSLFLTVCGSAPNEPQLDPTQGAQLLAGVYTTSISEEDVDKFDDISLSPDLESNQGVWIFHLEDDGNFNVEKGGASVVAGDYTVTGNSIKVYIKQVCEDCACWGSIGHYYYVLDDDELRFTKKAGSCDGMDLLLTTQPLTRQ